MIKPGGGSDFDFSNSPLSIRFDLRPALIFTIKTHSWRRHGNDACAASANVP
jgi:hypothetical protein